MILRALRALWTANRRLEDWFHDLSLRTRRIIAAVVTLAILVGVMLGGAVGEAEFKRAGQLA